MDAYSTRTVQVREKERELARAWERKHGRAPTSRELLHIANAATLQSRKGKDAGAIDWDALARQWDATLGGDTGRDRAGGVGRARPRRASGRASRRPGADRTARARGPGAGLGQGPGPGVGSASGLDPARPAQAARPRPACGNPADEPGGSPGAAARPGRGGAVRPVWRGGVPGGPGVAAAARVAAPRAGRAQHLHASRRRAVRHHRAAVDGGAAGRARADASRAAPSTASWPRGASAPIPRCSTRSCAAARTRRASNPRRADCAWTRPPPSGTSLTSRPHRRGDHRPGRHRQDPRPGHRRPDLGRPGVRHRHLPERHQRTPRRLASASPRTPPGCSPTSSTAASRPAR